MGRKALFIEGRRDGYSPDQCHETMTVSRLIECLKSVLRYEGDIPVYLINDEGYTYGSIDEDSLNPDTYESENDEKEGSWKVYACGGDHDGEFLEEFDDFDEAINYAYDHQDEYDLGCLIEDPDGEIVEGW